MAITSTGHLVFIGVDDLAAARNFYEITLGLSFVADEMGTLLFDMNGTPLRVSAVKDFKPQSFSVLGWSVADIEAETDQLIAAGIEPIRYPGMPQGDRGIATLGPARILWFNDPAGNVLSLTQV
jgi:catechol 2,3-dioxygenase-like lactoylglutathione lyase family enzyme